MNPGSRAACGKEKLCRLMYWLLDDHGLAVPEVVIDGVEEAFVHSEEVISTVDSLLRSRSCAA